jgi:hypothetical protein
MIVNTSATRISALKETKLVTVFSLLKRRGHDFVRNNFPREYLYLADKDRLTVPEFIAHIESKGVPDSFFD